MCDFLGQLDVGETADQRILTPRGVQVGVATVHSGWDADISPVRLLGSACVADLTHLPTNLRNHLFAFRNVCFELPDSMTPHSTQGELENSEQLRSGVVKFLRDAHSLIGANVFESGLILRHVPRPPIPLKQSMAGVGSKSRTNFLKAVVLSTF